MKLELVNITNTEVELYNCENMGANSTSFLYSSSYINPNLDNYYSEYLINNLTLLIHDDKILVKWNDFLLNKEYSLKRLQYEFNFYSENKISDKYLSSDFLRRKRQLYISYLQSQGSDISIVKQLLNRYINEIDIFVGSGADDLKTALQNETTQPYLTYLNQIVGVVDYLGITETVKDSVLRNIK